MGATVDLDVSEIEDAGIREVLQTPGAAYGAWSILDALLTPTRGHALHLPGAAWQAREVKVALSGLFGRFVARAYLERYFSLSRFAHLGNRIIDLDRRRQVRVTRLSRPSLTPTLRPQARRLKATRVFARARPAPRPSRWSARQPRRRCPPLLRCRPGG
jgi:hypothetical protein